MTAKFNFLPQAHCVQSLLDSIVLFLPTLPDGEEKQKLIANVKEYEQLCVFTSWSVDDVRLHKGDDDIPDEICCKVLTEICNKDSITDYDWDKIDSAYENIINNFTREELTVKENVILLIKNSGTESEVTSNMDKVKEANGGMFPEHWESDINELLKD